MTIFQSIFLGAVQGLTEFIPISSSGHLQLIPDLLGWTEPSVIFILFAHLGTLLALIIYFRHDLLGYTSTLYRWLRGRLNGNEGKELKLMRNIIIGVIPAGLLGLLLESKIEELYQNSFASILTAITMLLLGIVFLFEQRIFPGEGKGEESLDAKKSLVIGASQAVAFIRGTSRSGITVLTGRAVGLSRVAAAKFSFLVSMPIIAATSLLAIVKLTELPSTQLQTELSAGIMALMSAFLFGYLAIRFLLDYLAKNSLKMFGWYRIIFACLAIALLVIRP